MNFFVANFCRDKGRWVVGAKANVRKCFYGMTILVNYSFCFVVKLKIGHKKYQQEGGRWIFNLSH